MTDPRHTPPARKRRRAGIRSRITAVSVGAVAIALVIGAIGFWLTLRSSLYGQLDLATRQDAVAFAEQADQVGEDALPDVDDDRFWQLIDRDSGSVVAGSDLVEDLSAIADRNGTAPPFVSLGADGVFAVAAERESGDVIVVAGRSTSTIEETLGSVATLLTVAVPLIALVVGITTWIAVGRALAPVERMRRQVDAVTASDLSQRVEDPRTGDELGRLAHTLNDMLGRLEDSQRAQRRFISDASHELKSPLAVLRQYAEVAAAHPERVSADELTETVLDEGQRLERLVQGMLVLARADERALTITAVDVDLDDVLYAEAQRLRALGKVETDASAVRPVRVHADAALVRQAVRNLVDNAARHARTRVVLSSDVADGMALVTVDDDGPGVPPDQRERVFERFVRLDDARSRDAGGSGLGLAIVREIAVRHGGSARLAESLLGGARAELRLPLAPAD
ncbi:ATP-binding protein [Microbacterium immunditiarum]|uniref:histidine kinase n=1 Tax=Microbacterium immunditiarum TaxID=337480 RepID=A0A7Y9GMW0_9MICO|nr:signal transduction histidine kinase [Microbacterium immunditiarum]